MTRSEPSALSAETTVMARQLAVTCAFAAATTPPLPAPPGLAPPEPPASLLGADQQPRHHSALLPSPGRGTELDIDAAARGDGLNISLSAPQLGEGEGGGGSGSRQRSVGGAPSGIKPQVRSRRHITGIAPSTTLLHCMILPVKTVPRTPHPVVVPARVTRWALKTARRHSRVRVFRLSS